MNNGAALVGAAGLVALGAWIYTRQDTSTDTSGQGLDFMGSADTILTNAATQAQQFTEQIMGTLTLSNMARVTASDVQNANVQALLAVIRRGEGTSDQGGYSRLFGGGAFESYADHPRVAVSRTMGGKKITSTAAGAYQFLASTWDETARIMGLGDFSPAAQDLAAVGRIAARGALVDARAGRIDAALYKVAREWASMPGSPYGQPVISLATARNTYATAGGTITA